ncbi:hypothetical protein BJX70DRAFT_368785 [Aspergillus crustosus]
MTTMSLITAWLALAATAAAAISYPAAVEIDVLFPRNETYSPDQIGFPVVFAVQNAEASYDFGWLLSWQLRPANEPDSIPIRGSAISDLNYFTGDDNEFRYYFGNNIAVVPAPAEFASLLDPGQWRFDWTYGASPCTPLEIRPVGNTKYTVASGTVYFTLDENATLEFEIPLDDCPVYGDSFRIEHWDLCPTNATASEVRTDPCAARLESQDQVDCIEDFMRGRNETATCRSAFTEVDGTWATTDDDNDAEEEDDGDQADDSGPQDDTDLAISYRPGLVGLAVATVAAVAFLL